MGKLLTILGFVFLIFIIALLTAGVTYRYAVYETADDVVTALEMVAICTQLGNVTTEEIKSAYIKVFILNETKFEDLKVGE